MFSTSVRLVFVASLLGGLSGLVLPVHAADKPVVKAAASTTSALIKVDNAWIRATVKGQSGTGGFMSLTASQPLTLVGFSTSVATESELHEMAMDGNVMRMHAVPSLPLPAGQTVELRPGMDGHHLMLMGLKHQLRDGDKIPLTLQLRAADGRRLTQKILVQVRKDASQDEPHGGMHH